MRRLVAFVLSAQRGRSAEVSIAFVDDPTMAELHGRRLGDPTPTDVLTFDLSGRASGRPAGRAVCGELVVCVEQAARAAVEYGTDVRRELMLYLVHGLLHLLGYDDKTPAGFRRMHRREDELLEAFGVGRVFGPGPARRPARRASARA